MREGGFTYLQLCLLSCNGGCHTAVSRLHPSPGLATMGTTQATMLLLSLSPPTAKFGLQPNMYTATTSAGATVVAGLHLWPLSLPSTLPPLLIPIHPPSEVLMDGSLWLVCVCWAGTPLLNYSCSTWCNFKMRNQGVFSLHHGAYITWRQCIFIFTIKYF